MWQSNYSLVNGGRGVKGKILGLELANNVLGKLLDVANYNINLVQLVESVLIKSNIKDIENTVPSKIQRDITSKVTSTVTSQIDAVLKYIIRNTLDESQVVLSILSEDQTPMDEQTALTKVHTTLWMHYIEMQDGQHFMCHM